MKKTKVRLSTSVNIIFCSIIALIFLSGVGLVQGENAPPIPYVDKQQMIYTRASELARDMGIKFNSQKTPLLLINGVPVKIGNRNVPRHLFTDEEKELMSGEED